MDSFILSLHSIPGMMARLRLPKKVSNGQLWLNMLGFLCASDPSDIEQVSFDFDRKFINAFAWIIHQSHRIKIHRSCNKYFLTRIRCKRKIISDVRGVFKELTSSSTSPKPQPTGAVAVVLGGTDDMFVLPFAVHAALVVSIPERLYLLFSWLT